MDALNMCTSNKDIMYNNYITGMIITFVMYNVTNR